LKIKSIMMFIIILLLLLFPGNVFAETQELELKSNTAILLDVHSGNILYNKNANTKIYPASLTKLLTAIVVVENTDLNNIVTVTSSAVNKVEYGYVTADLKPDEQLTVEQLLNIILIASSNDASIVLAEYIAGSEENFASLMNEKANEIGCLNSNFTNSNGLHEESHYTTAYDLALISKYFCENQTLFNISRKTRYTLPITNKHNCERTFATTNEFIDQTNQNGYYYQYASGLKTGYTTPAGYCLSTLAESKGLALIAVVVGAENNADRYEDCKSLFKYGFSNFTLKSFGKSGDCIQTISIENGSAETRNLDLILTQEISIALPNEVSISSIDSNIVLKDNLKAPIKKGDIVGSFNYVIGSSTYSVDLVAGSDVKATYLYIRIVFLVALFLVLVGLFFLKKSLKNVKTEN